MPERLPTNRWWDQAAGYWGRLDSPDNSAIGVLLIDLTCNDPPIVHNAFAVEQILSQITAMKHHGLVRIGRYPKLAVKVVLGVEP